MIQISNLSVGSFTERFPWTDIAGKSPLSIAHRGASDYALDNSAQAFEIAATLGADMWEVDVRTSRDGVCVLCHDADLLHMTGVDAVVAELDYKTISGIRTKNGESVLQLKTLLKMAIDHDTGVYIDAKDEPAVNLSLTLLRKFSIKKAIVATGSMQSLRTIADEGCEYPLAVLVPPFADPFKYATQSGADIIHLCWEHATSRPQDLVTPELIDRAGQAGLAVVLWHEERPEVIRDLVALPVLGICSNRPEMLKRHA